MNISSDVSAFSHMYTNWHSINWKLAHRHVRKLQVRIAKATTEKQWRRVKALQRLLTRSFAAKAIAVKRVTENRGKRTAGVDQEVWSTPDCKWSAISRLNRQGYKPKALRRVYIPKANGKARPLGIPTMTDRAMQALYLLALEPVSETLADHHSYGFRPMRCAADAVEQCFVNLSRKSSAQWVLEGDIKGCFDNISHDWLIANIPMDKVILRKWLKSGIMESGQWVSSEAGTPQGGIISPVLANMALDGLGDVLAEYFGKKNTKAAYKTKVNYVRYADDFIITGISKELLALEIKPVVETFMAQRGLTLSEEKTLITHISEGFDFLGQNFRKYNDKLLIKPSRKNLCNLLTKVKSLLSLNKTVTAGKLIMLLNPVLRGWANYHRHIVAKQTFNYVDYRVWKMLWQWCRRRHGNRRKRWIKSKYFHVIGTRSWVFTGDLKDGITKSLVYVNDTVIKRHTKIKGEANPYNPAFELYFEKRLERAWKDTMQWQKRIFSLWIRQQKRCPCCQQLITKETGWNIHHIVPRVLGGADEMSNLVLLHPNCHRQLHANSKILL